MPPAPICAPAAAVPTLPAVATANAQHMQFIEEALEAIRKHPLMAGVETAAPLDMAHGGREPLTNNKVKAALAAKKIPTGAGNFFWLDLSIDPVFAHAPVKSKRCREIADKHFSEPCHLISNITVAVPSCWQQKPALGTQKLRRISPVEPLHTLIMAIHRDVEQENAAAISQWREILLTTMFTLAPAENDTSVHQLHTQLREKPGVEHELVRHSALSRILDVVHFHQRYHKDLKPPKGKKVSLAKLLSEEYNKGVKLNAMSEPVSELFVERAISIDNRLLQKSSYILAILMDLDDSFGVNGPIDSVHKIYLLLSKAGASGTNSLKKMEWFVGYVSDLFKFGGVTLDECSKGKLVDQNSAKSLGDVILAKPDILAELLRWAQDNGVRLAVLEKIKEITQSIETFREAVGRRWDTKTKPPAAPWRAGFGAAGDQLLNLIEDMVYFKTYDHAILAWALSRKPLAELLETPALQDVLAEIKEAAEEENKEAGVEGGRTQEPDSQAMVVDPEDEVSADRVHGLGADAGLQAIVSNLKDSGEAQDVEDLQKLERFMSQAQGVVNTYCSFALETETDADLVKHLKESAAGSHEPKVSENAHVLCYYSAQDCGEATSQPHLRTPALRNRGDHLQRFIHVCMQRRGLVHELPEQDVFALNDSGREGNKGLMLGKFTAIGEAEVDPSTGKPKKAPQLRKSVRCVTAIISENSLAKRVEKVRGYSSVNQIQRVYLVSGKALQLTRHDRLHTANASNRGNMIGPFVAEDWEGSDVWKVPGYSSEAQQTRRNNESEEDEAIATGNVKNKTREKHDLEPVLFHSAPIAMMEEILHSYSYDISAVISNAGDGKLCELCLERKIPFWGLAWTQEHIQALEARLTKRVFDKMADSKSKLYKPALRTILDRNSEEQEEPEPIKKRKRAAKGKAQAKKKEGEGAGDGEKDGEKDPDPEPVDKKPRGGKNKDDKGGKNKDDKGGKNKDDKATGSKDPILDEILRIASGAGGEEGGN
ncbi:sinIM, partial [Symbiodinium sp. CCMP2456]